MATQKRVRWVCPNGRHPAVLGSTRPRKDAVVRYCLDCSQEVGYLVERTPPVLEKERRERAKRTKEKDKTKAERQKEKEKEKCSLEGHDLREDFRRILKCRTVKQQQIQRTRLRWLQSLDVNEIVRELITNRAQHKRADGSKTRCSSMTWGTSTKQRAEAICRIVYLLLPEWNGVSVAVLNDVYHLRLPLNLSYWSAIEWLSTSFQQEAELARIQEAGIEDINLGWYRDLEEYRMDLAVAADARLQGDENAVEDILQRWTRRRTLTGTTAAQDG